MQFLCFFVVELFVGLSMVLLGLTTLMAVVTVYIQTRLEKKKGLPKWLNHVLLTMSRFLCVRKSSVMRRVKVTIVNILFIILASLYQ